MQKMLLSLFLLFHFVVVSPQQVITHLKFVSQWGPHYCFVNPSICNRNITNEFTIHGIWPDSNLPPPPKDCNRGPAYNRRRAYKHIFGPLEVQLSRDWPDLSGRQTPNGQQFWKHEWDTHGTCSYDYYNQSQYFSLAPNFRQDYPLKQILENGNIRCCMGNAYPAQLIYNAIFASTWHHPDLRCRFVQGNGLLLTEIIICRDINNRNVIDCPNPSTSCYYYRGYPMSVTY